MTIRSRAPLRISFGGGGTDVAPYCDVRGGAVLSATIDRFAYATLKPADRIVLRSLDYDVSVSYDVNEPFVYDGQLDLAKVVIDHFRSTYALPGVSVFLHNDAPPGSGLGSSSAIVVALVSALATQVGLPLGDYEVAELAHDLERVSAGIKGGKQDHYATTFGGFNYIEFCQGRTVVNSLRLRPEIVYELEYSLVFAYVGGQHFSGQIIERQMDNFERGESDAVAAMDRIKELAVEMKNLLLLGKLREFGALLDDSWQNKKRMADGISTPAIDEVYAAAIEAGAWGGKLSGAGGGGFMFFLTDPERKFAVEAALEKVGAHPVRLSFIGEGVRTWRA